METLPAWPSLPDWERLDLLARDVEYTSLQFPLRKMPDGRVLIDAYVDTDESTWGRLWERADDPALAELKARWPHIPRAVLAPYRAENILAIWRATDAMTVIRMHEAQRTAWETYRMSHAT